MSPPWPWNRSPVNSNFVSVSFWSLESGWKDPIASHFPSEMAALKACLPFRSPTETFLVTLALISFEWSSLSQPPLFGTHLSLWTLHVLLDFRIFRRRLRCQESVWQHRPILFDLDYVVTRWLMGCGTSPFERFACSYLLLVSSALVWGSCFFFLFSHFLRCKVSNHYLGYNR